MTHDSKVGFSPSISLTPSDVSWYSDKIIILLKKSKTDKTREGVRVTLGQTDSEICPVKALALHWSHREALFPGLLDSQSPLFLSQNGLPVSKDSFSARLAALSAHVGVEGSVTAHSLRIGAATAAWLRGCSDSQIQALGRWKSDSFKRYLRIDSNAIARLTAGLLSS